MAAYDVQLWANSVVAALGAGAAANSTINCVSTTLPVNCTIVVRWTERIANSSGAAGSVVTPDYTLYVEP